jgi:hypothetical protein
MTSAVRTPEADEALISVAQNMMGQRGGRSERVCYYRAPERRPDGQVHTQAGWIGWDQTQEGVQLRKIMRGYIPLQRYGVIEAKRKDEYPDGPFEIYGPWGQLLTNPEGVREIPAAQIIAYFWYDENQLRQSLNGNIPQTLKVRNGMVLWPQLKGMDIKVYQCPECSNQRFNEPIHLARHLRNWHDYDRQDIIAFGNEQGVDFRTEVSRNGKIMKGYAFEDIVEDESAAGAVAESDDGFNVEVAKPSRGRG